MTLPRPVRPYRQVTKRNAAAFFADCMVAKPERIAWISDLAASASGARRGSFDLSRESLVPLWDSTRALVNRPTPAPFGPNDIDDKPEWFHQLYLTVAARAEDGYANHPGGYDLRSLWIMDGLAYYFGEVFVRQHSHLTWQPFAANRYEHAHLPHVLSSEWPTFNVCPWQQVRVCMVRTWLAGQTSAADDFLTFYDALIAQGSR